MSSLFVVPFLAKYVCSLFLNALYKVFFFLSLSILYIYHLYKVFKFIYKFIYYIYFFCFAVWNSVATKMDVCSCILKDQYCTKKKKKNDTFALKAIKPRLEINKGKWPALFHQQHLVNDLWNRRPTCANRTVDCKEKKKLMCQNSRW